MSSSQVAYCHPFTKAGTFISDGSLSSLLSDTAKSLQAILVPHSLYCEEIFLVSKMSLCLFSSSPDAYLNLINNL